MQYVVLARRLVRSPVSPVFDRLEDVPLPGVFEGSLAAIAAGREAFRLRLICQFGIYRIIPRTLSELGAIFHHPV